jgi:hypothetical protein
MGTSCVEKNIFMHIILYINKKIDPHWNRNLILHLSQGKCSIQIGTRIDSTWPHVRRMQTGPYVYPEFRCRCRHTEGAERHINLGVWYYPKIRFGFFGLFLFRSSAIGNRSSAPKLRDRQFGVRFLVRSVWVGPKRTDV